MRAAHTDEAFGDEFYLQIQRVQPELQCLFVRPRHLQHQTFIQLVETMIQYALDPEDFYLQVGWGSGFRV